MDQPLTRYTRFVGRHARVILLVALVVTAVLGAGIIQLDADADIADFELDVEASADAEAVAEHFGIDRGAVTTVVLHDGEVLSSASLAESIELQRAILQNETVGPTLDDDEPTADTATTFVQSYLRGHGSFHELTLDDIERTLRTIDDGELIGAIDDELAGDRLLIQGDTPAAALLPADFDGETDPGARLLLVFHDGDDDADVLAAQEAIDDLAGDVIHESDHFVGGEQLLEDRAADAIGSSFAFVGPVALGLLVAMLAAAYRSRVDLAVSIAGIAVVLVWTAGIAGWSGLTLTQLMVAVPLLLIGLSVDYGLHVLRRFRASPSGGVPVGLAGVFLAISITSITTAVGFVTGVLTPVAAVGEFGVLAGAGILVAAVVYATVVPALRVELGGRPVPEADRHPIDVAAGRVAAIGAVAADRTPIGVLVVALVLTGAGVAGAVHVDTTVDRTDFYPDSPPAPVGDDEPSLNEQLTLFHDRFDGAGGEQRVDLVIEGDLGGPGAIDDLADAADDEPTSADDAVVTPVDIAERLGSFDDSIDAALADGDLETALTRSLELSEAEVEPFVSTDSSGDIDALRMVVLLDGESSAHAAAEGFEALATEASDEGVSVTATGGPVVTAASQSALFESLWQSFVVTVLVTAGLLVAVSRRLYGSATLGATIVLPVVAALTWVLGTMWLLGVAFTAETVIITGVAVGLGVDYAIHLGTRFQRERIDHSRSVALTRAVEETGATLVMSAITTAAAMAVLLLTFVPSVQRFGLLVVLVVLYAVAASVLVLPSLLVVRERVAGVDAAPVVSQ